MTETPSERFKWGAWTPEEDAFILANRSMGRKALSLKLGRTEAAIGRRFQTMPQPDAANGSEPEKASAVEEDTPPVAAVDPVLLSAGDSVLGAIEAAVIGMTERLSSGEIDGEDAFPAIKLLIEAWDRIWGLEP